jgi:1,4-dihydroxy-2-naphthoate octaprenyltransferase
MPPSLPQIWWTTLRPKTLFAALSPVLMGGAMAWADGVWYASLWVTALGAAVAIQIGTNFCNDLFDHKQGADTEARQGPRRGLQTGRISTSAMALATTACFALAALLSLRLWFHAGAPVFWISLASILSGIFYTAGRHSLAYTGLADLFVIVFFGPVAVAGTYFVQAPAAWPPPAVFIAALGPGLIATALLTVNNLRDIDEDRQNRKRTLAVRFGRRFARAEYTACLLLALAMPGLAALAAGRAFAVFALWLLLPLVLRLIRAVRAGTTGAELNPALGRTGKFLLLYSVLFAVGWVAWN